MSNKKQEKRENINVLECMAAKLPQIASHDTGDILFVKWCDEWLEAFCTDVKSTTRESYESDVENHIKRVFPTQMLSEISTKSIQMFILSLQQGVGIDKPLKPKTIRNIHGVLHKCLQCAVDLKLISENPADKTRLPIKNKPLIIPFNNAQVAEFLQAISDHRYEVLFKLALFTGMRQAEVIGLTWDCFNFTEGTIRIYQQVIRKKKTKDYYMGSLKNGKARVIHPAASVMQMMLQYKSNPRSGNKYVFPGAKHEHLTHAAVRNAFKKIVRKMDCPASRFHDLRHTYATMALKAGIDPRVLSELMGHQSVAFTLDTYSFVLDEMRLESANRFQKYMDENNFKL